MPVSCGGADLLYTLYFHMEPLGLVGASAAQPGPAGHGDLVLGTRVLWQGKSV